MNQNMPAGLQAAIELRKGDVFKNCFMIEDVYTKCYVDGIIG